MLTNEQIQRAMLQYKGGVQEPDQAPGLMPAPVQSPELAQVDQAMATLDMQPPSPSVAQAPQTQPGANPYQQFGQAITDASTAQQKALAEQQDAVNRAALDRDIATEGNAMDMEREAAENAQRQQAYQAEQAARMKEAKDFLAQADKPIVDRRDMGNKVAGAIAIALSGLGDAIAASGGNRDTGHMKRTMAVIDAQVDRDIAMQRENLANKRAAAGAKFSEMGVAQGMFADQERAAQFAVSLRKEAYANEMAKYAANIQDAEKAGALKSASEQIKVQSEQQRFALAQAEMADRQRRAAAAARQQAAIAKAQQDAALAEVNDIQELVRIGTPEALAKAKSLAELDDKQAGAEKTRADAAKLRGETSSGPTEMLPGYMATQSLRAGSEDKARNIYAAGESIKADLRRLSEIRAKNGGASWDKDDIREARQILNTLPSRYSQMFGSGAPNNTELELFAASLVDPTDVSFRGDVEASYKRLENQVDRTAEAQLSAYGMKKIDPRESFSAAPSAAAPTRPVPSTPAAPQMVPMLNRRGGLEMVHADMVNKALELKYTLASDYDPILNRQKAEAATNTASAPKTAPAMEATPNVADMTDDEYARWVASTRGDL